MYEDYEVHKTFKTFPPAYVGDEIIAVLKNGNKGLISGWEAVSGQPIMFQVQFSENGTLEVSAYEIDHYLTPPKPKKMPDHEGLWKDKDGDLWVYDGCELLLVKCDEVWKTLATIGDNISTKRYAPFTEMEVREKVQ